MKRLVTRNVHLHIKPVCLWGGQLLPKSKFFKKVGQTSGEGHKVQKYVLCERVCYKECMYLK